MSPRDDDPPPNRGQVTEPVPAAPRLRLLRAALFDRHGLEPAVLDAVFDGVRERLPAIVGRGSRRRAAFVEWLTERLAPRNVAGLADPARRNLYPVDLDVLVERAGLLGLSRREVVAAVPRLRGDS